MLSDSLQLPKGGASACEVADSGDSRSPRVNLAATVL